MKRRSKRRTKRSKTECAFLISAVQAVIALSVSVLFFMSAVIFQNDRLKQELFKLVRENDSLISFEEKEGEKLLEDILGKAKFTFPGKEPVALKGNLTSPFGKRINPVLGKKEFHKGIDLRASEGEKVRAAYPGKCVKTGFNKFDGNYVLMEHGNFNTKYCHLSEILIWEGAFLRGGEALGKVGHTGLATGDHLHFEIIRDGKYIDPVCAFEGTAYEI